MIADITGFTTLTERALTSKRGNELVEELTGCMNNYFDEVPIVFFKLAANPVNVSKQIEMETSPIFVYIANAYLLEERMRENKLNSPAQTGRLFL